MVKQRATGAPDDLSLEDKRALVAWIRDSISKGLLPPAYKERAKIRSTVTKCLLHHGAKGTEFVNWLSATKNWFMKQAEFDGWKETSPRRRTRKRQRNLLENNEFKQNLSSIDAILKDISGEDK